MNEIKDKRKPLESLYNFGNAEENAAESDSAVKEDELRKITYKIEDNTAEIMNYDSIIEASKKSLKDSKKDYEKAKKEYDNKSFGALLFNILTFCGVFASVYFFVKWLGESEYKNVFKTCLFVSAAYTVSVFFVALYKNLKVRPLKKKMKRAKNLMRDSKTWIDESERGMKLIEDENRILKKKRKGL